MDRAIDAIIEYPGGIFIALAVVIFLGALQQSKNLSSVKGMNVWKAVIVFCSVLGYAGFQLMLFKLMC